MDQFAQYNFEDITRMWHANMVKYIQHNNILSLGMQLNHLLPMYWLLLIKFEGMVSQHVKINRSSLGAWVEDY